MKLPKRQEEVYVLIKSGDKSPEQLFEKNENRAGANLAGSAASVREGFDFLNNTCTTNLQDLVALVDWDILKKKCFI